MIYICILPKSDMTCRIALNLKPLNVFAKANLFKYEDQKPMTHIFNKYMYLAKLDFKDTYFLITVIVSNRKYLRFNDIYEYIYKCLSFGLNCVPYIFTKVLKPVILKKISLLIKIHVKFQSLPS